uniref:Uncharacterized protein n=1 Tax=Trichuris muris TaxID=70415 RepID=A0A5S6Q3Z4_TRIMR
MMPRNIPYKKAVAALRHVRQMATASSENFKLTHCLFLSLLPATVGAYFRRPSDLKEHSWLKKGSHVIFKENIAGGHRQFPPITLNSETSEPPPSTDRMKGTVQALRLAPRSEMAADGLPLQWKAPAWNVQKERLFIPNIRRADY